MKLATRTSGGRDGRLVVVSRDLARMVPAMGIADTLQDALDAAPDKWVQLEALSERLNRGEVEGAVSFQANDLTAPLPRAWQWLDGSAYPTHGKLMQRAFNLPPIATDPPLMYQGMSHQFLGPRDDVALPSESDGVDFEGEFGVITSEVPMGVSADEALSYVRLVVQINDWSLRAIAPIEMKTGFGWIGAKPACSLAPIAVTPDELGGAWQDGRIDGRLDVRLNEKSFGSVPTLDMQFGFHELIAHAAKTRRLCAGTIIGSGTVSSADYATTGSCCLAERRAIETIEHGAPCTPYMSFGDRVQMSAFVNGGCLFGVVDQQVVPA